MLSHRQFLSLPGQVFPARQPSAQGSFHKPGAAANMVPFEDAAAAAAAANKVAYAGIIPIIINRIVGPKDETKRKKRIYRKKKRNSTTKGGYSKECVSSYCPCIHGVGANQRVQFPTCSSASHKLTIRRRHREQKKKKKKIPWHKQAGILSFFLSFFHDASSHGRVARTDFISPHLRRLPPPTAG